ncbi:MAG: acyltransferase family protein [Rubrivivax sp.]
MTTPPFPRALFLDWLRIGALGWLVVYHVMAYYARWPWHVHSPQVDLTGPWVEPLMRLSSPWRMSLLFLVSGAATAAMLARDGARGAWLSARARRLLLPLLAGVLLIVPPQSWLEVRDRFGYCGSLPDFMRLYLSADTRFADAQGRLILPTWNHLWFLPYLFTYTSALWVLLRVRPQALQAMAQRAPRLLRGWRLALVPLAAPAAAAWLKATGWPQTHALVDDPASHLLYAPAFVFGAVLVQSPALQRRLQAWRWPALGAALLGWALFASAGRTPPGAAGAVVQSWAALVALLGFAQRHLDRDHRWRAPLADAVFPVYLLHQTVIVVLAVALRPVALHPLAEGPLLVAAVLLAGAAFHRAVRPWAALRPWVGLSPMPARATRGAAVRVTTGG